jgi:hypothetical protein
MRCRRQLRPARRANWEFQRKGRKGQLEQRHCLVVGGLIGLVSSLLTTLLAYQLEGRRLRAQLARENLLRHEEREREDRLRQEEWQQQSQLHREEMRRQSVLREADNLWRDSERWEEALSQLPAHDLSNRHYLEQRIADWTKRRNDLLKEERALV